MKRTYVTTVLEEGDDLILPFPDTLVEDCGWKVGDVLEFKTFDGYATITKSEDPQKITRLLDGDQEYGDGDGGTY